MKKIANYLKSLWKDESAQGATEYILLVVVVVAVMFIFRDRIKEAVSTKMDEVKGSITGFQG